MLFPGTIIPGTNQTVDAGKMYTGANLTGSTPANQQYNAWVAAGRPTTNAQGQQYDVRGQLMNGHEWSDWDKTMQQSYGVPNPGTLGGTSTGTVPPAGTSGGGGSTVPPAGANPGSNNPYGYTGYGNSNIGMRSGTPSTTGTSTSTNGFPPIIPNYTPHPSGPMAPPPGANTGGTLSGLQQLLNSGNNLQVNPNYTPTAPGSINPFTGQPYTTNPTPTTPTPTAPSNGIPQASFAFSDSLYNKRS